MSKRGQYTYDQVVNQLQYEMSIDSSEVKRTNLATRFSDFIYVERWHNLCLDNQIFCANRVMELFNIEPEKAVAIQQNIIRAYQIADQMQAVGEIIQQQHITVTNVINSNLLSTNKLQPKVEHLQILPTPKMYQGTVKVEGNTQQIIEYINVEAGKCWGSNALRDTKVINLSNTNTTGSELENLAYTMRQFNFNLDKVLVQNNNIGDQGIHALINGITSTNLQTLYSAESGWKPVLSPLNVVQNVVYLNLSYTNIGDAGAEIIANALAHGQLSATRVIDVSGNKISIENPCFAQLAKNIQQPIKIVVDTIYDGAKKQGTLAFGSKEAKQGIVQDWVNIAQSNGIDTKNVVVSKGIWDLIDNTGNLISNFSLGWVKCSVMPNDLTSFAADKIIAVASPEAGVIKTGIDIAFCYFESCDEAMSSQHGIQFLGDLRLLPQESYIDAVE